MNEYLDAFKKYFVIKGRTNRRGYWFFVAPQLIVCWFLVGFINTLFFTKRLSLSGFNIIYNLLFVFLIFFILIPILIISIRRLHDINKSGWYILINAIPFIGQIWFFILMIKRGDDGNNNYGIPYSKIKAFGDENINDDIKKDKKSTKLFLWIKNNKKSVIILSIVVFIVIIIGALMFLRVYKNKKFNIPYLSSIVDTVNMINSRGEKVDKFVKGTFKNIDTGEVFEYKERYNSNIGDGVDYNENAVSECITNNCSFVYFKNESNNEQEIVSLFNSNDNYQIGFIYSIDFNRITKDGNVWSEKEPLPHQEGDIASYEIHDPDRKNVSVHAFNEDLCVSYKGGDLSCHSPSFKKGDTVYFPYGGKSSVFKKSDIIKAQLLSYQYIMIPNTGEYFPVVQVNH